MKQQTVLIIGAGPAGLTLAQSLLKKNGELGQEYFQVKIFERDTGPQDRWQGYHIALNQLGAASLLNCLPPELFAQFHKVIPTPLPTEVHGVSFYDDYGKHLASLRGKPSKDVSELSQVSAYSMMIIYRDRLRDLLLKGINVQWGKKCVGYEENEDGVVAIFEDGSKEQGDILVGSDGINSPIRKQKLPHLQINKLGLTSVNVDVAPDKKLIDRLIKCNGSSLLQLSNGPLGDMTFQLMRLVSVEQEKDQSKDISMLSDEELHYRITIAYSYPSARDEVNISETYKDEDESKIPDENDPKKIIEDVKRKIKEYRRPSELTDIILELFSLVPLKPPTTEEEYPFITYNPPRKRPMRDINPASIPRWTTTRVTLLGDAIHAMNPLLGLGTNNAMRDAETLSNCLSKLEAKGWKSCIQEYENEMIKRTSKDVLSSRKTALRQHVVYKTRIGFFLRNTAFRILNVIARVFNL